MSITVDPMTRRKSMYQAPDIVYEGELEAQAGSPVGLPVWDDIEDL
jgi:hypothetical protein